MKNNNSYLIAIGKNAISNITASQIHTLMKESVGGVFVLDKAKTDRVNVSCNAASGFADTDFSVFVTGYEELYNAVVHVREIDGRVEVFNVTSDNPKYSNLDSKQIHEVLDAFRGFIGSSVVQNMNITTGNLYK